MVILNALTILIPETFSEIILDISAIFKLDFIAFLICDIIGMFWYPWYMSMPTSSYSLFLNEEVKNY